MKGGLFAMALMLVILSPPCSGQITRVVPVEELVNRAELIVAGQLVSGRMSNAGGPASLTIKVDRLIAGDVQPGTLVNATWTTPPPQMMPPYIESHALPKECGLWFFARSSSGSWSLVPAMEGSGPVEEVFFPQRCGAPGPVPSDRKNTAILDDVIQEIGAAVESWDAKHHRFGPSFFAAVRDLDSDTVTNLFEHFASSSSPNLRSFGLAGLIERGHAEALVKYENELGELAEASHAGMIVESIELFYRNPNREGVDALGRLATAHKEIPSLVRAATHALRVMHTEPSLKYLAQLLDSEEPLVRYDAMAGLASFANAGHVPPGEKLRSAGQQTAVTRGPLTTDETLANFPTVARFAQDEVEYVSFWKGWWLQHRAELSP